MSSVPPEISSAVSKSLAAQTRIVKSTPGLTKALSNTAKQGLPDIAISPAQGQYLAILCKTLNAKNVLEIGTLGGYSTLWFAGAVEGVKVTSIEVDARHRDVAIQNLEAAGVDVGKEGNVDVILGAALDVLPTLAKEGKVFDFVFIDAAWEEQAQYFDWAVKLTRQGGLVYVDNAVRQLTESEDDDPTAMALIEAVEKDGRVEASLIPTLNTHKETLAGIADGFLIASVL